MLNITLNNVTLQVREGSTILDAAKQIGIKIPTLCHLDMHSINMVNQVASCRVCMVEVEGRRGLAPACATSVTEGMVVRTNTPNAVQARRTNVELLLSNHPKDCFICPRNQQCELQAIAAEMGIREIRYEGEMSVFEKDKSSPSIIRDPDKCILCRRCETMCNQVQTVGVYSAVNRGFNSVVSTAFDMPMGETTCVCCGQCVSVCPTSALIGHSNTMKAWHAINDPDKFVIVQTAPAVRAALGEVLGFPVGTSVTGKMVAVLRRMGFDKVYDTDFTADLTIMEETHEFLNRVKNGGKLPLITSCCPAWIKFIEHNYPDLLDHPSSCKSPQQMLGAMAKTYIAEKLDIDPRKIVVVSVMPCIAKKYEATRPELATGEDGNSDVDIVISTRELGRMIRASGLTFETMPDEDFDSVMGESTGAGVIFGCSGGVTEAVVRTAVSWLTEENPKEVDFVALRGNEGVREATYNVAGIDVKLAVSSGLGNARELLEAVRDGKSPYHAIEIMACPGGCVAGGGQPYYGGDRSIIAKRAETLYGEDKDKSCRLSHENKEIKKLYEDFLGEVGGHKAHELLHTSYTKRDLY